MHNLKQVTWFGMFLGVVLLGCPPAAKDAKDAKQEAGQAAGDAQQSTEEKAGDAKDEAEKKTEGAPAPAPGGGW